MFSLTQKLVIFRNALLPSIPLNWNVDYAVCITHPRPRWLCVTAHTEIHAVYGACLRLIPQTCMDIARISVCAKPEMARTHLLCSIIENRHSLSFTRMFNPQDNNNFPQHNNNSTECDNDFWTGLGASQVDVPSSLRKSLSNSVEWLLCWGKFLQSCVFFRLVIQSAPLILTRIKLTQT